MPADSNAQRSASSAMAVNRSKGRGRNISILAKRLTHRTAPPNMAERSSLLTAPDDGLARWKSVYPPILEGGRSCADSITKTQEPDILQDTCDRAASGRHPGQGGRTSARKQGRRMPPERRPPCQARSEVLATSTDNDDFLHEAHLDHPCRETGKGRQLVTALNRRDLISPFLQAKPYILPRR